MTVDIFFCVVECRLIFGGLTVANGKYSRGLYWVTGIWFDSCFFRGILKLAGIGDDISPAEFKVKTLVQNQ